MRHFSCSNLLRGSIAVLWYFLQAPHNPGDEELGEKHFKDSYFLIYWIKPMTENTFLPKQPDFQLFAITL